MKIKFLAPFLFMLLGIACISSCDKHKIEPSPNDPDDRNDTIQFTALKVGEKYKYLCLSGEKYGRPESAFQYLDDTLELEVLSLDDKGYLISERLNYVGDVGWWVSNDKDETFEYYLNMRNDTLRISSVDGNEVKSRIFFGEAIKGGLPFRTSDTNSYKVQGWELDHFYCECRYNGYTTDYALFEQVYDRLNVTVENKSMTWDGPGETYLYSPSKGIVRSATYYGMTGIGHGWDRLP